MELEILKGSKEKKRFEYRIKILCCVAVSFVRGGDRMFVLVDEIKIPCLHPHPRQKLLLNRDPRRLRRVQCRYQGNLRWHQPSSR